MADDTNKPADDPQKKQKSLLDQVTTFLNNPDVKKGLTDLTGILSDKSPSPDQQEILDDLKKKDEARLKAIKDLQDQIKANEAKIASNDQLLQQSRDAVAKLDQEIDAINGRLTKINQNIGSLAGQIEGADTKAAEDAKKNQELDKHNEELKEELGF